MFENTAFARCICDPEDMVFDRIVRVSDGRDMGSGDMGCEITVGINGDHIYILDIKYTKPS